jgi:hypothetical protein
VSSYELIWRLIVLLLLIIAMMKAKIKTKNNLCGRDCDPAFSFIFKNKKRDISAKYILCNSVSSNEFAS